MSYISDYYKSERDLSGVFTGKMLGGELEEIRKEINRLNKKLDEQREKLSSHMASCYNVEVIPINKPVVFTYSGRNLTAVFDAYNGCIANVDPSDEDSYISYNLGHKSGDFSVIVGYCYQLGSVVIRTGKYSISANNSKMHLTPTQEFIVPILEPSLEPTGIECTSGAIVSCSGSSFNSYWFERLVGDALRPVDSTEFVSTMYSITDKKINMDLRRLRSCFSDNKSTEIILRTVPEKELSNFLTMSIKEPKPIHKILGVEPNIADRMLKGGTAIYLMQLKNKIESNPARYAKCVKTDSEWADIIEKAEIWKEKLRFYGIRYNDNIVLEFLETYCGGSYPHYFKDLPNYYKFSKFCNYIVDQSVDQGYSSIDNFMRMLADYISMCQNYSTKPTLYSRYLQQTHDIVVRNHKISVTPEQEEIFKGRYDTFPTWKGKTYSVIAPSKSSEVMVEGDVLNHCSSAYIKTVIDGGCHIAFLRLTEDVDNPLVTLEIREGKICQAKGLSNRDINAEERSALEEYCKKSGYELDV